MINEKVSIVVEGEHEGILTTYVMDNSTEMTPDLKRPAMVICPGGGYEMTSDREAEPVAIRMLNEGFQVFVLRYSVYPALYPVSLLQLAKSIQLIRKNSELWHVNVDKIIVAGFSAGGHLAASLGVTWHTEKIGQHLEGKPTDWRPNALLLGYPVISSESYGHQSSFKHLLGEKYEKIKGQHSIEKLVTEQMPPTFLWHTLEDDVVLMENSLELVKALRQHHVLTEFHLFSKGGHGLSLGTKDTQTAEGYGLEATVAIWPTLFVNWCRRNIL